MDKHELARLKKLAEKTTPGPWKDTGEGPYGRLVVTAYGLDKESGGTKIIAGMIFGEFTHQYIAAANPQTVLVLIDDLVKTKDALAHCRDKNSQLEKEADWLADQLLCCNDGKEPHLCPYECDLCGEICTTEVWREAARKAVEAGD